MALANDAAVRDGEIVGDPTEAALVVLAAKGGLDVDETRRIYPRVAEVPFDSDYKLMATFHEMEDDGGKVVRCFVKGAPDVLLARSAQVRDADGELLRAESGRDRSARRERPARRRGPARPGRRLARHRPRGVRPGRRRCSTRSQGLTLLALVGDRRPAAQGGEGRDRTLQGGRHPRAHDHGRPRDDRRRDRGAARDRGACAARARSSRR